MYKTSTTIAAAAMMGLLVLATPQQAEARNGRVAAGIIGGIAAGAIIGSIIANRGYGPDYYYAPGPYYYAPGGYYYGSGPYAYDGAMDYCMRRFRSYDPRSGTYLGYDGYRHPCP
jgi:hypothetical protein